jgi:hypothetical protein
MRLQKGNTAPKLSILENLFGVQHKHGNGIFFE